MIDHPPTNANKVSIREVDLDIATSGPKSFLAYARDPASMDEFVSSLPSDTEEAVRAVRSRRYPRQEVVDRILPYLKSLQAPSQSLSAANRLAEPNTVVVATGQQPVLGTPLMILYKAITAIATARSLERCGLGPAVALFWCHSADHDIDEINNFGTVDPDGFFRRHRARIDAPPRTPIERLLFAGPVADVWEEVKAIFPDSEFGEAIKKLANPGPKESVGSWMSRILLGLLGRHGLVVVEPFLIRDLFGPLHETAVEKSRELSDAMSRASFSLRERGLETPLDPTASPFLFRLESGPGSTVARTRVRLAEDLPTLTALVHDVRSFPRNYSPSAALRPVYQSALFPVAVSVGGPGEIAYHLQLRGCFDEYSLPMPILVPRFFATIVDAKNAQTLTDFEIDDKEVPRLWEHLGEESDRQNEDEVLPPTITEPRDRLLHQLNRLTEELLSLEPALEKPVIKTGNRIEQEISRLIAKFAASQSRSTTTRRNRRKRLVAHLCPNRRPQERTFSSLQLLSHSGIGLVDELVQRVDPFRFCHRIVRLPKMGIPMPLSLQEAGPSRERGRS